MSPKPLKRKTKGIKNVIKAVKECHISTLLASEIILNEDVDLNLLGQWPKPKMRVPTIFLHKTVDFAQHVRKLLSMGIAFYQPYLGTNYTRILCSSFNDHKNMLQYFEKRQLPFHTFGHPNKRKMRVVIRGLPKETDIMKLKLELKNAAIPVIRAHVMNMKEFAKKKDLLVLVVVPFNEEGHKLLRVKTIFGHEVKLEPPINKTRQCHRCQKWGHSQRYCHGEIKCVKCAGDHFSAKCTRDPEEEPPTCANCGGNHTASYRECFYCPDSTEYKQNQKNKINRAPLTPHKPQNNRELVTFENYESLYKKVKNIPKHTEAVPF